MQEECSKKHHTNHGNHRSDRERVTTPNVSTGKPNVPLIMLIALILRCGRIGRPASLPSLQLFGNRGVGTIDRNVQGCSACRKLRGFHSAVVSVVVIIISFIIIAITISLCTMQNRRKFQSFRHARTKHTHLSQCFLCKKMSNILLLYVA